MPEFNPRADSLLTAEEWEVYSRLSEAWNTFIKLPEYHRQDRLDFTTHINALKSIVMSRPVERELQNIGIAGYEPKTEADHALDNS